MSVVVSVLHDELKLLVDLVVLGFGAGSLLLGVGIAAKVVVGTAAGSTLVILFVQGLLSYVIDYF